MKILQWNARSLTANKYNLINIIKENFPDIITISETWNKPNKFIKISKYFGIFDDRTDGKGGSAIFIKENLKFKRIDIVNNNKDDIQICGILVENICILSMYIKPNFNLNIQILNDIYNQTSLHSRHIIWMGDFNAHNVNWGSYKNNHNGSILKDFIDSVNLIVNNDKKMTLMSTQNSVIDLAISSADLSLDLSCWTLDNSYGSDHFPVVLILGSNSNLLEDTFFF